MEEDFQDVLLANKKILILMAKVIKINLIVNKRCLLQLYSLAF